VEPTPAEFLYAVKLVQQLRFVGAPSLALNVVNATGTCFNYCNAYVSVKGGFKQLSITDIGSWNIRSPKEEFEILSAIERPELEKASTLRIGDKIVQFVLAE